MKDVTMEQGMCPGAGAQKNGFPGKTEKPLIFLMAERAGFEPADACASHALQACLIGHSSTSPREQLNMAERAGFEPALHFSGDRFSRAAPSTTRTPLQRHKLSFIIKDLY